MSTNPTPAVEIPTVPPAQVAPANPEVDYKAVAEALKTELVQAQHKIIDLKKDKKGEVIPPAADPAAPTAVAATEQVDVETLKAELREENRKELEKFKMDQSKTTFEQKLLAMSSNPDEREAIKAFYESKIVKSGFSPEAIESDLINARLLANRPKFEKTMSELKQTVQSQQSTGGGSTTGQPIPAADNSVLSPQEEAWVKSTAATRGLSEADVRAKLIKNKTR